MDQKFLLPSSADVRRPDRFALVDSDDEEVHFWDLLTAILRSESAPIVDIPSFIQALETIAVTLRGTASDMDFGLLREFMSRHEEEEPTSRKLFPEIWPALVDIALAMPSLFPEGTLPSLSSTRDGGVSEAVFSRKQIACLVVHQFLCSLPPHPWPTESFFDLHPWYSMSSTVHRGAVDAYLTALFTYFGRLCRSAEDQQSPLSFSIEEWPIVFTMRTMTDQEVDKIEVDQAKEVMMSSTHVDIVNLSQSQTAPPFHGLPDGACVISANKCIGYGPSGTQEELNTGISPEAYPAVLLAPPLSDKQVLICRGAEAMASIHGYGRDAKLAEAFRKPSPSPSDSLQWKNRTMLFMDALELDVLPVAGDSLIPDIYPSSRLFRDMILKAYNAFSSETYSHIVTGLWGCGTFGGNRYIKCILQWCAAALAGIRVLRFVFATSEQRLFGEEFATFVTKVQRNCIAVKQMFDLLTSLSSIHEIGPDGIFTFIADQIR
ncbi:hypothetical protein BDW59DRAFT_152005 [Aspergillus cavernicola]|uniref:poly(ADP-ribose) glycohydrolase n=1 Tax=Aspergillus cavernicola TaxID=176166 RepID=A0ABR4HSP0_9EURO